MFSTRTVRPLLHTALASLLACSALIAGSPPAAAATATFTDGDFDPADWEEVLFFFGNGGEHGLSQQATGGAPGGFLQVELILNGTGAGERSQVDFVYVNRTAVYDPSTEGEITALHYSELARSLDGRGAGLRVAPALRQGGQIFFAPEPALFGAETEWTRKEAFGLVEADFRTIASSAVQPDFTASGGPIEFGFFRAVSNVENTPPTSRLGGIDEWRVEVNPTVTNPPLVQDEIRAEAESSKRPASATSTVITDADSQARPPQSLADRVDAVTDHGDYLRATGSRAHASLAGGLGCFSRARGPEQNLGNVPFVSQTAKARASHLRRFTAVADSSTPPGVAGIDIFNFVDGALDLDSAIVNAPLAPVTATVRTSVEVRAANGLLGSYARSATLGLSGGSRSLIASAQWRDSFAFDPGPNQGEQDAVLDYAEFVNDLAFVPVGTDFTIEFVLETETVCNIGSATWIATADFENTARFDVTTDTPGVRLVEVHTDDGFDVPSTVLSGKSRTRFRRLAKSRDAAGLSIALGPDAFTAEDDLGSSLRGTVEPKGRSGRKFRLYPDEESLGELLAVLARKLSAKKEQRVDVSLRGDLPVGKVVLNRRGTRMKVVLAVRLVAEMDGVTKNGVYRIAVTGPPPETE